MFLNTIKNKKMNTSGNTILITGGTSGIGLAFAEEFIKNNNTVIITGRRQERLEAIKKKFPNIIIKNSDVANNGERVALTNWAEEYYPQLNIFKNNAGIQLTTDLTSPADIERISLEVETNFIAPTHLASLFAPIVAKNKDAAIINITSGLAFVPIAFMPVYCATKAAMHSITLSLRHQLKKSGVKVFEIAPPAVDTELGHDRRTDKSQSHGGIPVVEFIEGAMNAIKNDQLEAPIGMAIGLKAKGDTLFEQINSQF